MGARSSAVGWDTALQAGRSRIHLYNPSGRAMALGSTPSLTKMSISGSYWGVKAAGA